MAGPGAARRVEAGAWGGPPMGGIAGWRHRAPALRQRVLARGPRNRHPARQRASRHAAGARGGHHTRQRAERLGSVSLDIAGGVALPAGATWTIADRLRRSRTKQRVVLAQGCRVEGASRAKADKTAQLRTSRDHACAQQSNGQPLEPIHPRYRSLGQPAQRARIADGQTCAQFVAEKPWTMWSPDPKSPK